MPIAFDCAVARASMATRITDSRQIEHGVGGTPFPRSAGRQTSMLAIIEVDDRAVAPLRLLDFPEPKESERNRGSYRPRHRRRFYLCDE